MMNSAPRLCAWRDEIVDVVGRVRICRRDAEIDPRAVRQPDHASRARAGVVTSSPVMCSGDGGSGSRVWVVLL